MNILNGTEKFIRKDSAIDLATTFGRISQHTRNNAVCAVVITIRYVSVTKKYFVAIKATNDAEARLTMLLPTRVIPTATSTSPITESALAAFRFPLPASNLNWFLLADMIAVSLAEKNDESRINTRIEISYAR
jgi:hypothetical protein